MKRRCDLEGWTFSGQYGWRLVKNWAARLGQWRLRYSLLYDEFNNISEITFGTPYAKWSMTYGCIAWLEVH